MGAGGCSWLTTHEGRGARRASLKDQRNCLPGAWMTSRASGFVAASMPSAWGEIRRTRYERLVNWSRSVGQVGVVSEGEPPRQVAQGGRPVLHYGGLGDGRGAELLRPEGSNAGAAPIFSGPWSTRFLTCGSRRPPPSKRRKGN